MLSSDHAGERDNAALAIERMRRSWGFRGPISCGHRVRCAVSAKAAGTDTTADLLDGPQFPAFLPLRPKIGTSKIPDQAF
jgi:hypothetical protein